jgi:DNA-binding YbaB/EbfC family protein
MIKQAKKLQEKMADLQAELESRTVTATAGGGMVTVVMNGKYEVLSVKIEREVINPEDAEMLQDLIAAAVNEGTRKVQEMTSQAMSSLTGGFNIPGLA